MKIIRLLILVSLLFTSFYFAYGQEKLEFGISGGLLRFMPDAKDLRHDVETNRIRHSMSDGYGWSAGAFAQYNWRKRIRLVADLNYYTWYSDLYFKKLPEAEVVNSNPHYTSIIQNYIHTLYNSMAFSAGMKFFISRRLFFTPAVEFSRTFNEDIITRKNMILYKLAFGADFKYLSAMFDCGYNGHYQKRVFDSEVPFYGNHKTFYGQFKLQIPILKCKL